MVPIQYEVSSKQPAITIPLHSGHWILTRLIKREQSKGALTGFPIEGGCNDLGHLLYADDYLLLAKAIIEEACSVNEALKKYLTLSGQRVITTKS